MKKNKSRTYLAVKNTFFNCIQQIINTIANIILPPLIISTFGSAINGLISTVKQIINYIQLVGAGISESTIVSLYKPLNDNDTEKVSAIYNASEKTFNKAGTLFFVISLIFSFTYPFFLKENFDYLFIVKIVIILCVSGVSEFFALGKYRTLLTADQKIYIVNIVQIIGTLLSTISAVLLIKAGCNILIVQFVSVMFYVLRIFILYFYIHKKYNYLNSSVIPDYAAVSKRKYAFVHQIASLIIFGSQTLFIARYCGLKEASVYSIYNLIFTGINTILSTVSSAMIAGMGNLIVSGDDTKVRKVYNIYEFSYYIFVFTFYITAFSLCLSFVNLYVGSVNDVNYLRSELVILFSTMGILNCLRTPGGTMINANGHYKETQNRALIEMTICLIGEILFVKKLGIVGVLVATILAYLYRTIDVIIYTNKRILNRPVIFTIRRIILNLLVFGCMVFILSKLNLSIDGYSVWALYATIITIIGSLLLFLFNYILDKNTFKSFKEYAINLVRR